MAKFKVGDRVRIKEGEEPPCGDKEGYVIGFDNSRGTLWAVSFRTSHPSMHDADKRCNKGHGWWFFEENLDFISEPGSTTPTLKPGARVRLLQDDDWSDDYKKGDIFTAERIEVHFYDKAGDHRSVALEDVELVTTPLYEEDLADIRAELAKRDQTYKVGDAVLIDDTVAVVVGLPNQDGYLLVENKDSQFYACLPAIQPLAA